jgi:hypothetical protein
VPDRRGSRFLLEVLFLLALALGLALAKLRPLAIAGVMLVGWVIVAALEWAAWRSEPHYGSGLPPRYYVPRVNLPPARPLEPVAPGYPEAARDEAPTWIASAALREEMLGDWPMAAPAVEPTAPVVEPVVDPWLVTELPAAPLADVVPGQEPEQEPEPEAVPAAVAAEPMPESEPRAGPKREPGPEPIAEHGPERVVAHYYPDPLAELPARRRFGRGRGEPPRTIEVPARPIGARPLPGRARHQE